MYAAFEAVGLLTCTGLILLARPVSYLLLAGDFFIAWQYVPLLLVSALFSALSGFLAAAFRAEKRTGGLLVSVLLGAAINILLNLLLLPTMGLQGAALATALSFFGVWLVRLLSVQRLVRIRVPVLRTVLAYLLLGGGVLLSLHESPYAYPALALVLLMMLALRAKEILALCRLGRRLIKK